jgi:ubiquinone/menaquinone biosynthesis C-methylase UbiE
MATQKAWENYWRLLTKYAPTAVHEQAAYAASLQRLVTPGIKWLDAGCGHNVIAPWLKGSSKVEQELLTRAALVIGCDRDAVSLEKDSPIRRVACDLGDLPFRDAAFDLVTCNMVVEHLEKPAAVFREFFRVLKGGGQVLILTPNLYHWSMLLSAMTPRKKRMFSPRCTAVILPLRCADTCSPLVSPRSTSNFSPANPT